MDSDEDPLGESLEGGSLLEHGDIRIFETGFDRLNQEFEVECQDCGRVPFVHKGQARSFRALPILEGLREGPQCRFQTSLLKLLVVGAACIGLLYATFVSLDTDDQEVFPIQHHEAVYIDKNIVPPGKFEGDDYTDGDLSMGMRTDSIPECQGEQTKDWHRLVLGDPRVPTALNASFSLTSYKRMTCDPPLPPLEWDAALFVSEVYDDKEVVILHRYADDCKSESYVSQFRLTGNPETRFSIEVHREFHGDPSNSTYSAGDVWTLLGTSPGPCWLVAGPGIPAQPRLVSPNSNEVINAAKFAANEISFRAKEDGCLAAGGKVKLGDIKSATVVVAMGLKYKIECKLLYDGMVYAASLTVLHRCSGTHTQCFYQLELPDGKPSQSHPDAMSTPWCDPLLFRSNQTIVSDVIDEDRTDHFVSQRVLLYLRQLTGQTREPLQERYITRGEVPPMHDLREDDCLTKVAVYNTGHCNAGYAGAWNGMMGARLCMEDKKSRRLQVESTENTYGVEYDGSSGVGYDPESDHQPCQDDDQWSVNGIGKRDCAWFAIHGCEGIDQGQFTHCRLTCGSCSDSSLGTANPYALANYQYMPSIEDMASCAKEPSGQPTGCNGGNMWAMWDNYLAKAQRPMYISGAKCKNYTLKCWHEKKIVNPLNAGLCWTYENYQLWHRPCSCIPETMRPETLPGCGTQPPPDSCDFHIPPAAFVVRGFSSGLSIEDANLNFQRHILESGPLYVALMTSQAFFNWDWKKNPVYTGGAEPAGGTAMMMLGWGGGGMAYIQEKFWILRNSWGADWQDNGNCLWLRGENLHGIENQAGVIMATSPCDTQGPMCQASHQFEDWTAPICRLTSWKRKWSTQDARTETGGIVKVLKNYTLEIGVRCSEDCVVKAFFSNKLSAGQIKGENVGFSTFKGVIRQFHAPKSTEVKAPFVSLHLRGYGIRDESMWLALKATDKSLNSGTTESILSIPAVEGAEEIQERKKIQEEVFAIETTTPTPTTPKASSVAGEAEQEDEVVTIAQLAKIQAQEEKEKELKELEQKKAEKLNAQKVEKADKMMKLKQAKAAKTEESEQQKAAKIEDLRQQKQEKDEKIETVKQEKAKKRREEEQKKAEKLKALKQQEAMTLAEKMKEKTEKMEEARQQKEEKIKAAKEEMAVKAEALQEQKEEQKEAKIAEQKEREAEKIAEQKEQEAAKAEQQKQQEAAKAAKEEKKDKDATASQKANMAQESQNKKVEKAKKVNKQEVLTKIQKQKAVEKAMTAEEVKAKKEDIEKNLEVEKQKKKEKQEKDQIAQHLEKDKKQFAKLKQAAEDKDKKAVKEGEAKKEKREIQEEKMFQKQESQAKQRSAEDQQAKIEASSKADAQARAATEKQEKKEQQANKKETKDKLKKEKADKKGDEEASD